MVIRETKRILLAPITWCSCLIFAIVILLGIAEDLSISDGGNGWFELLWLSENFGIGCLITPLIFPLAFAINAYEEKRNGYDWLLLLRSGYFRYCVSKTFSCLAGTVAAYTISMLMAVAMGCAINPSTIKNCTPEVLESFFPGGLWGNLANRANYWISLFVYLTGNSLNIALFSMIAVCTSVYATNLYIVCAVPFLLYRLGSYFGGIWDKMNYTLYAKPTASDSGLLQCLIMNALALLVLGCLYFCELKGKAYHA